MPGAKDGGEWLFGDDAAVLFPEGPLLWWCSRSEGGELPSPFSLCIDSLRSWRFCFFEVMQRLQVLAASFAYCSGISHRLHVLQNLRESLKVAVQDARREGRESKSVGEGELELVSFPVDAEVVDSVDAVGGLSSGATDISGIELSGGCGGWS